MTTTTPTASLSYFDRHGLQVTEPSPLGRSAYVLAELIRDIDTLSSRGRISACAAVRLHRHVDALGCAINALAMAEHSQCRPRS